MGNLAVLDVREVSAQVQTIQKVMAGVMVEGSHYGKIPGCPQPTLLKPGAEKLFLTFGVTVENNVDDLSTPDVARYRVTARALSRSGEFLGSSVGEASTDEEKYRWRAAVCPEEYEEYNDNQRRIKFGKKQGGVGHYTVQQVRTNPADLANTVLKMAVKRAMVALALQTFAASDIFAQDLEDFDPENIGNDEPRRRGKPATNPPQARTASTDSVAPNVVRMIRAKLAQHGIAETDYLQRLDVATVESIPAGRTNEALQMIDKWGAQ